MRLIDTSHAFRIATEFEGTQTPLVRSGLTASAPSAAIVEALRGETESGE